ncbi:MAG: alpha/beta fold hydrolase [Anaerolineae bacterium]|nr:alpha/beta fold hydrolase [Anaerolineae bacterium]
MDQSPLYNTPAGEALVMALYDAVLQNWMVPSQTQMVSTRCGKTFVIASGDPFAPPVVLLHGAGGNSAMWAGDVADYASQFRVYAVDLPGEAGKSTPNRPPWAGAAFGEWLEDVLNALNVEQASLVGISQGGWAALKFAVMMPERVTKLVLIAPAGIVPDRRSFLPLAIMLSFLGKAGIKRFVQALLADQNPPDRDGLVERVAEMSAHFRPRIGVIPLFSDAELRRLTMPILLLGGTKDICRDVAKIEARLKMLVPQLSVKLISGVGHIVLNTSGCALQFLTQP